MFQVIEKFLSIDGEGPTAGELAAFIRFGGCNLACSWCDTAYSIVPEIPGEWMDERQIHEYVKATGAGNVTLTGGEPLLQKGFASLLSCLSEDQALTVHVETNGSLPIYCFGETGRRPNVSFVVDYKLPDSGMEKEMDLENFNRLENKDVCKFVLASEEDLNRAKNIIDAFGLVDKCQVYLSPIPESIKPSLVVEFMKEHHMNGVRLQLQLHKLIWHPDTRCV